MRWVVFALVFAGVLAGEYTVTVYVKDPAGNSASYYWVKLWNRTTKETFPPGNAWAQTGSDGKIIFQFPNKDYMHDSIRIEARDLILNPNIGGSIEYFVCYTYETYTLKTGFLVCYEGHLFAEPVGISETKTIYTSSIKGFSDSGNLVANEINFSAKFNPDMLEIIDIVPNTESGFFPDSIVIDNDSGYIYYSASSPTGTILPLEENAITIADIQLTITYELYPCLIYPLTPIYRHEPYPKLPFPGSSINSDPVLPRETFYVIFDPYIPAPQNMTYIPGVPDWCQPPFSGNTNFCSPVAVLNILHYYQAVAGFGQAAGLVDPWDIARYATKKDSSKTADLIAHFMGTNGQGSLCRMNNPSNAVSGTFVADQDTGIREYVAWNLPGQFCSNDPSPPLWKQSYNNWTFSLDTLNGWSHYVSLINAGIPPKVDFLHWNIIGTNRLFVDPVTGDTFAVYRWGNPTNGSYPPDPEEYWNLIESPKYSNIGHHVTGVGYITNWDPDTTDTVPAQNWIIVHDNWCTTAKNIVVPWAYWVATIKIGPPPTLVDESSNGRYIGREPVVTQREEGIEVVFTLREKASPIVKIYDVTGRQIVSYRFENMKKGIHREVLPLKVRTGIYFLVLETAYERSRVKFVYIR